MINIPNGNYKIVIDNRNEIIATYTCKDGYTLVGNQNRTCQQFTNTWMGRMPTCVIS